VTTKSAAVRKMEKRDALKRERDLALREIGEELAAGRRQLEERAGRARRLVWSDFRKAMAKAE
jgi:hypothetical protein